MLKPKAPRPLGPPYRGDPALIIRSIEDLAAGLARRRKEAGLTELDLDELAGTPDGTTCKIELGVKTPGGQMLGWYLRALGVGLIAVDLNNIQPPLEPIPEPVQLLLPFEDAQVP